MEHKAKLFRGTRAEGRALSAYVALMRAAEAVTRRTHGHLAQEDLTLSQFGVLEALFHLGPQRQRALGEKILKSPGNMTTVVDNLERRALVERRSMDGDRRVKAVHLTKSGRALVKRIFPSHAAGLARDISCLSVAEQRQLAQICRKLRDGKQEPSA